MLVSSETHLISQPLGIKPDTEVRRLCFHVSVVNHLRKGRRAGKRRTDETHLEGKRVVLREVWAAGPELVFP